MKTITVKKNQIIYKKDEEEYSLYKIETGNIFLFTSTGSRITPMGENGPGSFLGEYSFFHKKAKIHYALALEESTLSIYSQKEREKYFPQWLLKTAQSICSKFSEQAKIITEVGIKKKNVKLLKPLSIEEQRHYYQLIK